MLGGATFDSTGAYRYHLWREWDSALPPVTFVMLNPSTADAGHDDPTIRRCVGFAQSWGYGRLEVVNLFAYRATSPRELFAADDPVGPENEAWLRSATNAREVVVAWGDYGRASRGTLVWIAAPAPRCLGLTALGQPRHPLYLPKDRTPQPWPAAPR